MTKLLLILALLFGADQSLANNTPLININTADAKAIATLNGIGEKRAQAIVDYRNKNGEFSALSQLTAVKGITPQSLAKLLEKNPNRITVKAGG